jgi:hypothetical protein
MTTNRIQARTFPVQRLVNVASAKIRSASRALMAALAFVVALSSASPAQANCPNVAAATIALDWSGQAYIVSQPYSYDNEPLQTMWYTYSNGDVAYCAKTAECGSYTESNRVHPGGGGGGGCSTISVASGSAYWAYVTASGGNGSYTYGASGLPSGLSISSNGLISGVATGAGTYWVTTTAQDSSGCSGSGSTSITVTGGGGGCGASNLDLNVGSGTGRVNQWVNFSGSAWGGCGGYTYTLSGATPPGLTFSNGGFSGTPTQAGQWDYTVTVTDSCGCSTSGGGWITITGGNICDLNTITAWGGGGSATVGSPYNAQITGWGGQWPYSFSVANLPPGLWQSGGWITGTPTSAGTYTSDVVVTDANGCTGNAWFTITVTGGNTCANSSLTIAVGSGNGTVNQWVNYAMGASGGCGGYTYSMTGSVPPGMWFNNTGSIQGTPTTAGTYDYAVTVTDSCGCTRTGNGWITITGGNPCANAWLSVWGGGGNTTVGSAYWALVSGSGGTWPYTYGATGLPPGLSLATASGWITGTPTAAGTYSVTTTVTDANGCTASNLVTIVVGGGCTNPTISPTSAPNGTVNTYYAVTFSATGGATLSQSGTLPPGLWWNGNSIVGWPTTAGTYPLWITATSGSCTSTIDITITIDAGCVTPTISPTTISAATQGTPYSVTFTASAGSTLMQTGTLPAGLTWNAATGTISGTPTASGTFPIWIKATSNTNASCVGQIDLNLVVNPCVAPTLAPATAPAGNVNSPYSVTFTATAGSVITQSGTLPPGLTWNAGTSTIAGTPTTAGTYNLWVTATRNGCSTTRDLTIVIGPAICVTPTISPTTIPAATQGTPYSVTFTASAGSTLMQTGTLPAGLTWNAATGTISGTPTATGTFPIWIKATSNTNASCVGQIDLNLVVNPCVPPVISPTSLPAGQVGVAYSVTFTATAGSVITLSGTLPAGLTWNAATATISGTPTAAGTITVWVTATKAGCSTTLDLPILINPAPVTLSLGDCVFDDLNGNGIQDDNAPLAGASVQLFLANGTTPATNAAGVTVPVQITGANGGYKFTGLAAGDYVVCVKPPAGYQPTVGGNDPDDDNNTDSNARPFNAQGWSCSLPITLAAGTEPINDGDNDNNTNLSLDFGFRVGNGTCATSWAQWQQLNPLGGLNGVDDNPDYDLYTNLLEYALCGNPKSGFQERGPCLMRNSTGGIDLIYLRGTNGQGDITYTLQGIKELSGSPTGWTAFTGVPTVTSNGNGTDTVRFVNVNTNALFAGSACGFLRLKVSLNGTSSTAISQTHGFCTRTFDARCTSFSHPFLKCEVFTGYVDAIVGTFVLNIGSSIPAGQSIKASFQPGVEYFLEVLAGDAIGQRYDIDEANSTATTVLIDQNNPRNTTWNPSVTVANCPIVIRAHCTLGDHFPKVAFQGTNNPSTADRILFFDVTTQSFKTYWLLNAGGVQRWVLAGDATATDRSGRVIDNGEGMFVHPKTTAVTRIYFGAVRQNDFVQPLVQGTTMIGMGYPLELSPVGRAQTIANGFVGTNNPSTADRIQFWQQDVSATGSGYDSYFLLSAGGLQQWTKQGDATLANHNNTQLYKRLNAGFAKAVTARPAYKQPVPWTP